MRYCSWFLRTTSRVLVPIDPVDPRMVRVFIQRRGPESYHPIIFAAITGADVVYAGIGNGPPGNVGALYRSPDRGRTWEAVDLGGTPNSTVWNLAFHPEAPELGFATAVSGHLYRTTDGGRTWRKLPHEFGETRGLAIAVAG